MNPAMTEPPETARSRDGQLPHPSLILLRHAAVASHAGDVPVTEAGAAESERLGRRLGALRPGLITLLAGPTRRARETGEGIACGLARAGSPGVTSPAVTSALRNPDLYLAGHRVDMVSTASAMADQVPGVTPGDVARLPFFAGFLASPERIGYWLHHPARPGETAAAVAERIRQFAASLSDARPVPDLVVAVTHSPILRALAMEFLCADPGEPGFLHGYLMTLGDGEVLDVRPVTPELTGVIQASPVHGEAGGREERQQTPGRGANPDEGGRQCSK